MDTKHLYLLTFFCLFEFLAIAQSAADTYYDDLSLKTEVPIENADFRKKEYVEDSILNIKIYSIKNNCLIRSEKYKNGFPTDVWISRDSKCKEFKERDFSDIIYKNPSEIKKPNNNEMDTTSKSYVIVDDMPQFTGGEEALFKFLGKNISFPQEAKTAGAFGIVYISFIVNEAGDVEPYHIVKSLNPYLDYEAWQTIKKMPAWKPGKQKGEAVRVQYNLPIRFSLR